MSIEPTARPMAFYSANNDGFGGFGLRLTNIITSSIPQNQEAERFNDLRPFRRFC